MKNACKRLFSLMLAMVLLVSVVPFQAMAAETEDVEAQATTYTVIVYDENGWRENITVEAGGVVDAEYLAEKYDVEGYKTIWNDGNFVPGESRINEDNFVIGCKYEKLVTKYSVEFYAGDEWIGGIKVGTDGKITDGTVPTAPSKPGQEFVGWFHSAGEYKPGKTQITGDLVVGAKYEKIEEPTEEPDDGDKDDNDRKEKTFVITFEHDGRSIKAYKFEKRTSSLKVTEELAQWALEKLDLEDEYKLDDSFRNKEFEKGKDGKYYATVEVEPIRKNKDNVFVTFTYKDSKVGDRVSFYDKNADRDMMTVELAKKLMQQADIDTRKYELKTYKDRLDVNCKREDGNYYFTIALDKKVDTREIEITIYVDGNKKPVVDEKEIRVDADENFKDDHEDWLRKAWDKYSRYDYDVKDWDSNKDEDEYTVWLTSRKNNDDDEAEVYLDIYVNGSRKVTKTVKITDGAAVNGTVTMAEAQKVVEHYYTAKNSQGLDYDGLWKNEIRGEGKSSIDVEEFRYDRRHNRHDVDDVHVIIEVDNAKAKAADSTNPKTGDEIYMTITVMTLSAAALACAYVLNKKRIVK